MRIVEKEFYDYALEFVNSKGYKLCCDYIKKYGTFYFKKQVNNYIKNEKSKLH